MYTQLAFDLALRIPGEQKFIIQNECRLDVSDIARGAGFATAVEISSNLNDELHPGQNEVDGDYDQRLYDALCMARFKLLLDSKDHATFSFTFPRKGWKMEEVSEMCLRVGVITLQQVIRIGLVQDIVETP